MAIRFLTAFTALLYTLALLAGGALLYLKFELEKPITLAEPKTLVVPNGSGARTIAQMLENEGIISSRYLFRLRYVLDRTPSLKAGEYSFSSGLTLHGIIDKMAKGDTIMHKLTIPEGLTSAEIVKILQAEDVLSGTIGNVPPEGSLLPETYRYSRGDDRAQFISRMQKAMQDAVNDIWAKRDADLPITTPQELVVLASMIEKETGKAEERARVAGVFINRLRIKMPLQSDPTVTYGITMGQNPLGRSLTYSDLKKPTAYNTYTIPALPPAPIANPGLKALEAAANPEKNNFIFFVADGTGGHRFAATESQHLKNVALWRALNKPDEAEKTDKQTP